MPLLMGYFWPGNVRELENVIERAVLLSKGKWITPSDLPPAMTSEGFFSYSNEAEDNLSIKKSTKQLERSLIIKALEITGGNRSKASKILEISRPILISKIKEYGI
jgi:two-component system response regulator AtoC